MLQLIIVPVTPFQQNCSVVFCDTTKEAAVIDPGGDLELIQAALEQQQLSLEKIWITHGHLDHAGAAAELSKLYDGLPIEGPHRDDEFLLSSLGAQGQMFNLPTESFLPDRWLDTGDSVSIGQEELTVRHCPGHTPGHIIFYHQPGHLAIVGDVLFAGSIGRTDLPRGNFDHLIGSIRNQLWPLGDDITFVPGHGGLSTFKQERESNPYVADHLFGKEHLPQD